MEEDGMDVEIIEHHPEILGSRESLYRRKQRLRDVEERDLSYFDFIGQNECRKVVVGLFGFKGAGKTALGKVLGGRSVIRGTKACFPTETPYEAERGCTVHVHPTTVFLSGENGISRIMTLLDTSGHMDLMSETIRVLGQIDVAVLVFDVRDDLSLQYELILDAIGENSKPLVVVFNKMDLVEEEFGDLVARRLGHLRGIIGARVHPREWFVGSVKDARISRMGEQATGLAEDSEDGLDGLIEEIFWQVPVEHICDCKAECLVGFLCVEGMVLCNMVPRDDISTGSVVTVQNVDLVVEKLYLPFPGCLVESKTVRSNVGVLVKALEDPLRRVVLSSSQESLMSMARKVLERKTVVYTNPGFLEIPGPVVRVRVNPADKEGFLGEAWKLELVYRDLEIAGECLSGNGELFMDAVLYDLRNSLGVRFEVLSVSSNLKEVFGGSFREEAESLVIEGGQATGAKCWCPGEIERRILEAGPLLGEPVVHSYLKVSSRSGDVGLECLRKVGNSVAKHTAVLEPLYLVEITHAKDAEDLVSEVISSSFGEVIHQSRFPFSTLESTLCYLPVPESFGFETDLRVYSCSTADCVKMPLYWRPVNDRNRSSRLAKFIREIRRPRDS
ncbi:hypothetical protein [Encephalitozoon cuniculi GB-M1]|uniref:Tr-type G domain-containing protein n=1 Tax=Encephalitozoon cuniculi (strain GB-M1) TaxID=284813 RepID=Q8STS9_ENCCU|nr:uncharacterized protein ECU09_0810 [Encephalitozoon cuniculi GB-M1]CAD27054.1 hypothetical protein [Encephalitozoon cuniculi GB-M1]